LSDQDIRQAVLLIKAGRKNEAQKLLKELLERDLNNIHAWVWYVETLPTVPQKIRALEMCSRYNPDNERVRQGLQVLLDYQAQSRTAFSPGIETRTSPYKVCSTCGAEVEEWADVCSFCGTSLKSEQPVSFDNILNRLRSLQLPSWHSIRRRLLSLRGMGEIRTWAVVLIFILPAVGLCLLVYSILQREPASKNLNQLAIGDIGKVESVNLQIQSPIELDSMTKEQVLQLRRDEVYRYPEIVYSGYQPYEAIFDQIVDGLPWWGIPGQFYYGQGEQSIIGPSEESRFILNPYLLVAAEPCGMWDKNQISEALALQPNFPLYCPPTDLIWQPENSFAEVTYNAGCIAQRNYACFNLIAYNARDLNLGYLYVSYENSLNISKTSKPLEPYQIPQYIHQGDSCGYPGGCNNMSPITPEIDALSVLRLPAKAEIWLWKDKPSSLEVTADMVFVIHFK
jgi:hypothetical protein